MHKLQSDFLTNRGQTALDARVGVRSAVKDFPLGSGTELTGLKQPLKPSMKRARWPHAREIGRRFGVRFTKVGGFFS